SEGLTEGEGSSSALEPSDSASQGQTEAEGQMGRGGDGMGDGQGALDQDASEGNQQRGSSEPEENNPDGVGEAEYQAIFAPRFSVDTEGDDELRLGADPGEAPLTEG